MMWEWMVGDEYFRGWTLASAFMTETVSTGPLDRKDAIE
jgi:hypothetical protein